MSSPDDVPRAPAAPQPPQQPGWQQPPTAGGYAPPGADGYPVAAPVYGSAPSRLSPADEKLWAMLSHLGTFVLGFIAPLITMLVQGEKSPFVRRQAVESLNFQISLYIAYAIAFVLCFVLIGFVLLPIIAIGHIVLVIMATVAANRGEDYRYPLNIRLVK